MTEIFWSLTQESTNDCDVVFVNKLDFVFFWYSINPLTINFELKSAVSTENQV